MHWQYSFRCIDMCAAAMWRLFAMVWLSWAGVPRAVVIDQAPCFEGAFRKNLEFYGTKMDYVPRTGHNKLGRAERHDAAWRNMMNKLVDQCGLVGGEEMDVGAMATSSSKNQNLRRCGASPAMAVLGKEIQLPEQVMGDPEYAGAMLAMTGEQVMKYCRTVLVHLNPSLTP